MCVLISSEFLSFFFFNYSFMAVLGFHCCTLAFYSCGEWGLLSSCGAWVSPCSGLLQSTGSVAPRLQQLRQLGSVGAAGGPQSAGLVVMAQGLSYSVACVIFQDQGWNGCPLHCKADS